MKKGILYFVLILLVASIGVYFYSLKDAELAPSDSSIMILPPPICNCDIGREYTITDVACKTTNGKSGTQSVRAVCEQAKTGCVTAVVSRLYEPKELYQAGVWKTYPGQCNEGGTAKRYCSCEVGMSYKVTQDCKTKDKKDGTREINFNCIKDSKTPPCESFTCSNNGNSIDLDYGGIWDSKVGECVPN